MANPMIGIPDGTVIVNDALRDQFAMAALPAIITATSAGQHDPRPVGSGMPLMEAMARDAYLIADAMIAARGGK